MKIKQNKLVNYCAIPGVVLASTAGVSGATVIFYGVEGANDINADPLGIDLGFSTSRYIFPGFVVNASYSASAYFFFGTTLNEHFTDGSRGIYGAFGLRSGEYSNGMGNLYAGATLGDRNFANISFDGRDDVYEAVGQFSFDGNGGGFLVAIAFANAFSDNNPLNTSDLSNAEASTNAMSTFRIPAGAAAIDRARAALSVPEPSNLILLALGASGLMLRRKRKAA